jgi:hypothetical protein
MESAFGIDHGYISKAKGVHLGAYLGRPPAKTSTKVGVGLAAGAAATGAGVALSRRKKKSSR